MPKPAVKKSARKRAPSNNPETPQKAAPGELEDFFKEEAIPFRKSVLDEQEPESEQEPLEPAEGMGGVSGNVKPVEESESQPEVPQDPLTLNTPGPSENDPAAHGLKESGWGPKPAMAFQYAHESAARVKNIEVHFFNLADKQERSLYASILKRSQGPYAEVQIVDEVRKDFDWNVMVVVKVFEFKQYVRLERKHDED